MFNLSLLQFKIVDISRKNHSKWEEKSENELIIGSITDCIKKLIDSSIKLSRCKMKLIH
ncbi:conserved hypothetical protein [Staphylococcus argenteus]|uniref:Uncharacterized protein n=1 Tax=Staphylococcus argenteus TaxID=985002 RepID=A0A7U7JSP0_9STAP|nr:conserved hypothetical protein [Staphylococcus argenteus]CRI20932.1 conserved hypothetical protein [Staphylococcus argenteus]